MTGVVRYLRPRRDDPNQGRCLRCTRCATLVRVYEIPGPFINPARFVCGECQIDATMKEAPIPFSQQHRKDAA